jgi:uncharacterized phage protein (TIGR02220 family)
VEDDVKPDEKVVFCQIDAHLDTNPKIRRGGRDAREVFQFLLRRVAIMRTEGVVPIRYIAPWYLADQLMMTESDASNGVLRAVTAELIHVDNDAGWVRIVGWSDEWGRRPKSNSERQSEYRARKRSESDTAVTNNRYSSLPVTRDNESNVGEERRGEEKEEDTSGKPDPAAAFAAKAIALINGHAGTKYRPTSGSVLKLCRKLVRNKHTLEQLERVIASKQGWVTDPKMGEFFRPATLLAASNFAKYLDDLEATASRSGAIRLAAPQDDEPDLSYALSLAEAR